MPKQKNSASSAISSAVRAARGISIIVPTLYAMLTSAWAISSLAVFTTMSLTYFSSLASPVSGIMISGLTDHVRWAFCTLTAARITAVVCMRAISG